MARRFVIEVSEDDYQRLLKLAKWTRKQDPEKFKEYTWRDAAESALETGVTADYEYVGSPYENELGG